MTESIVHSRISPLIARGRMIGMGAASLPILIGVCGLLGWSLRNPYLTSVHPDLVPINPITAICMILAGLAMHLLYRRPDRESGGRLASAMAVAIMAAGSIRLLGFFTPWDIPLDRILFADRLRDVPFGPNHMAPNTAFNFVLLGGSLLAMAVRKSWSRTLSQGLGIVLASLAFFAILGYLFHFVTLYRVAAHIPMAVPTILGFLSASIAMLCLDPRSGPMSLLFSESTGGSMARRLLPVVIFVPTIAAWTRLQFRSEGYPDLVACAAQLTLANVIIASAAVYFASRRLDREDLKRRNAEEEIAKLNRSLQRQTERLEEANRGLESFSYSVSHDLRAPLRHVSGFAEMLKRGLEGKVEGKSAHYLDMISESANRMGALIEDLLGFAKVERTQIQAAPLDMEALVRECVRRVQPDAEGRKIEWEIAKLPAAEADRSLIEQVLVNLLSNALKYSRTRPEAHIRIGYAPDREPEGAYFVRDNGVGFDMKYAGKLFGVFQRMHKDSEYEGTGIGLANVRSIVQKHGGKVWAEAEAGQGAAFYFTLSLASDPETGRLPEKLRSGALGEVGRTTPTSATP